MITLTDLFVRGHRCCSGPRRGWWQCVGAQAVVFSSARFAGTLSGAQSQPIFNWAAVIPTGVSMSILMFSN